MQNLRKLNIFQLFKRLPFVIFKDNFLIPQRPFPTIHELSSENLNDGAKYSQLILKQINTIGIEKANRQQIQNSLSLPKESRLQYLTQIEKYMNEFIRPSILPKIHSIRIRLYVQQHGSEISDIFGREIQNLNFNQVLNHFKALPLEVKIPYEEKAAKIYTEVLERYKSYELKYKIPNPADFPISTPNQLYLQDMKDTKLKKIPKFSTLPKLKARDYKDKSKLTMDKYIGALSSFLKPFSLTVEEFQLVKQLCNATQNFAKLYKEVQKIERKKVTSLRQLVKTGEGEVSLEPQEIKLLEEFKSSLKYLEGVKKYKYELFAKLLSSHSPVTVNENKETITSTVAEIQVKDEPEQKQTKVEIKVEEKVEIKVEEKAKPQILEVQPQPISSKANPIIKEESSQDFLPEEDARTSGKSSKFDGADDFTPQSSGDLEELRAELKDEDLNDLDILQQDYEVLKLQKLIQSTGKSKLPNKRIN